MNEKLFAFEKRAYLNLETFRKSGAGVPTPVWFVEDNGTLYVRTMLHAGKVKRIRNNGRVRVAPCNARGRLLGEWIEGRARLIDAPAVSEKIEGLLNRKYGWQKRLIGLFNKRDTQWATIAVEV